MAFDISLDESPHPSAPEAVTFDDFYDDHAERLGQALLLACNDADLANKAFSAALVKTSQRWKQVMGNANPGGWALREGIAAADKTIRDRPPTAMNEATGGYVRGLDLTQAIAALPLHQRTALVTAYFFGWSDDHVAAGFMTSTSTINTRRTRAITFLAHHLRVPTNEVEALVVAYFGDRSGPRLIPPDMPEVRRRGRRRTVRNRLGAGLLVAVVIAAGGALFKSGGASAPERVGPEPVAAPNNSADWLAPVPDDHGGFIALNVRGSSRFTRSADGEVWFDEANWNSRAVDLRTEVTRFVRTRDGYVATIEAAPSVRTFVAPYVARSTDLVDWSVRSVDVTPPAEVAGMQSRYDVLGVAASGRTQLVALGLDESIDYRFHGIQPSDVCSESTDPTRLTFFLCDGTVVDVVRPESGPPQGARYLLADGAGPFIEVDVPATADPRSITGIGAGFAAVDSLTGQVLSSTDGQTWEPAFEISEANRLVLLESNRQGQALAVLPNVDGWASVLLEEDTAFAMRELPLNLDPAVVWTEPELAAGPAGWALFITTSRPWERADVSPGWAIDTGDWIVSRLPDSQLITARNPDSTLTYRFVESADSVSIATDGSITLFRPGTDMVLVEITQAQIDGSRTATGSGSESKAQVFFSADGLSWRAIWQSNLDTWFGSLAVGDDEVLLSGSRLTGPPIRIPLDG